MSDTVSAPLNQYEAFEKTQQERAWSLTDVPFYEKGKGPNVYEWHNLDYLDYYDKVYGRKFGSNGIGKLCDVGLTRITEHEVPPLWDEDPVYYEATGVAQAGEIDIPKMQWQQENYANVLEEQGVNVHWIEYPDPPISAFGPMQHMWAAQELLIVNGGSVIAKPGWNAFSFGRAEWLARNAFITLGIPPLVTVTGKGVNEAGASLFLAQDVFLTATSAAYNLDGVEQIMRPLRNTSGVPYLHFEIMNLPSQVYFDPRTGITAHPDMLIGPLDDRKVAIFSSGVPYETHMFLARHGFETVEVDLGEHLQHCPANLTILEPGKVVMQSESPKSVAAVRAAGIEVIEVPYSEFNKAGGGLACSTQLIYREPGPALGLESADQV